MANLTTDYLDKALTKQSKELKGFVKKEIEELALMMARGFTAQQKQIDMLTIAVNKLNDTVKDLNKTVGELARMVENLASMTAREFAEQGRKLDELAKKSDVTQRMDRLEREFAEFRHTMQA